MALNCELLSERSPAPLRYATKKVRMISELLIMVQDSIYHQPRLTVIPRFCLDFSCDKCCDLRLNRFRPEQKTWSRSFDVGIVE